MAFPTRSAVVAGALVLLLGGGLALRARGPEVPSVRVARSDLDHRIVASGRVLAPARVNVSATSPGLVVAVGAALGQHVDAGSLLVQTDDAEARASVAQAKAAVEQARARVAQLQHVGAIVASQELSQAQTNLAKAEADLARTSTLVASGAVPRTELETAQRALDLARARKNAAEAQQVASAPMGADSRVALGALLQAEAQRTGAEVRLGQTRMVATSAGTVLSRSVEPGDVVQPGRTLLVIGVDGDVELAFHADERNLSTIAVGQKALASADAFPNEVFDAQVSSLAPSIDPQRGTVEVRLAVAKPPAYLRPDMTVSIDLLVASKKAALVVPTDAVRGAATPSPWVLAIESGKAARRAVKLGIRGQGADGTTEITSGLAEGDEVIVPDGRLIEPGRRVRAVARAER
ncbi:MAG TPA: efflux RND transporter periplasmic adaptor subunit [Polyangiaceae bacterium]|nr:efflux RND transporter periplasmic adaptor subunit [Polyangiaceae bacterium]